MRFNRRIDKVINEIKKDSVPNHIAMIMDGNGRWAKKRGLPRNAGHRKGSDVLLDTVDYCSTIGVKFFTVYAFSTENWVRPKEEVDKLLELLSEFLKKADKELEKRDIKMKIIGDKTRLSSSIQTQIRNIETNTKNKPGMEFIIAFNYGGRDEIVEAVNKIIKDVNEKKINSINKDIFSNYLYTKDIPDPDLIIRTSGEQRGSNFLIWQSAYSEWYFPEALWPDFDIKELQKAIEDYRNRVRRYGGIKD